MLGLASNAELMLLTKQADRVCKSFMTLQEEVKSEIELAAGSECMLLLIC